MDTESLKKPWSLIALLVAAGFILTGVFFAGVKIVERSAKKTTVEPTLTSRNNLKPESPSSTTEWKTFKSPELGFSLKYPTDWPSPEVLRLPSEIEINLNNILSISTSSNLPVNLSFQDYMIGEYEGKIAIAKKADGRIEVTIVFPHPYAADQFLIITYVEEAEVVNVIEEILSTLEFVDAPEITTTNETNSRPELTIPVQPTESSFSVPTTSDLVPTPTSPFFPTPTPFTLPTPDPTTFDATQEECIYGCIPEDKFK